MFRALSLWQIALRYTNAGNDDRPQQCVTEHNVRAYSWQMNPDVGSVYSGLSVEQPVIQIHVCCFRTVEMILCKVH